jgi:GTP-binding protein
VRVSSTPGHTRLLSWFDVDDRIRFCDLPGYGYARRSGSEQAAWQKMVESYLQRRESLRAVAILVDVRRGFEDEEKLLIETCHRWQLQPLLVVTKCDQLKGNALFNRKQAIAKQMGGAIERDFSWYSAKSHAGRDELWARIRAITGTQDVDRA